jgi:hypothetical protein
MTGRVPWLDLAADAVNVRETDQLVKYCAGVTCVGRLIQAGLRLIPEAVPHSASKSEPLTGESDTAPCRRGQPNAGEHTLSCVRA